MKKNIAVIGCGYWGKNLVRTVHGIGALAAVSDSDITRAQEFGTTHDVPALSYDDILKNTDVSGVVLAVPAPLHAEMTLQALNAGKHVFVEKPIALNVDDAQRMITKAKDAGRILMVGHVLQYHPAFRALKQMVTDGALGTLRHIHSNRLNFGKVRTHENVFWSFAPHDVSMMLALAGRAPEKISAQAGYGLPESDIASTFLAQFDFGQGLAGHIHVSWLNPFKEQKLTVVGDKGMAVFDDTLVWDKKLAFHKNTVTFEGGEAALHKADVEYIPLTEAQPLTQEILHFIDCIENNKTPDTDGVEAMRVLDTMRACDKAAGLA